VYGSRYRVNFRLALTTQKASERLWPLVDSKTLPVSRFAIAIAALKIPLKEPHSLSITPAIRLISGCHPAAREFVNKGRRMDFLWKSVCVNPSGCKRRLLTTASKTVIYLPKINKAQYSRVHNAGS
jgi:hypothetical protein